MGCPQVSVHPLFETVSLSGQTEFPGSLWALPALSWHRGYRRVSPHLVSAQLQGFQLRSSHVEGRLSTTCHLLSTVNIYGAVKLHVW